MHGLLWFLGVYPVPSGTSAMYQLWSGFIPALAIMSLVGGLWSHFKHINCHVHGCWRVGRYHVASYLVCRRHHPDAPPPGPVTQETIKAEYANRPAAWAVATWRKPWQGEA